MRSRLDGGMEPSASATHESSTVQSLRGDRDIFDVLRERYNQRYAAGPEAYAHDPPEYWLALAERILGLVEDVGSVGHLGCGRGELVAAIASLGKESLGVDISTAALARPASGAGGRVQQGSVVDLPCREDQFDLTVILGLLHRVPLDHVDRALGEIARVTKKYLFLTLPVGQGTVLDSSVVADRYVLQPEDWWESQLSRWGWSRFPLPECLAEIGLPFDDVTREVLLFHRLTEGYLPVPGSLLAQHDILRKGGPDHVLLMAGCMVSRGNLQGACRVLKVGKEAYPMDDQVALHLGSVLVSLGEHIEAETVLDEFVKTRPNSREAYSLLANAAMLGGYTKSRDAFRRFIQTDRDTLDAMKGVAAASYAIGDFKTAQRFASVGADLHPSDETFAALLEGRQPHGFSCFRIQGQPGADCGPTGHLPGEENWASGSAGVAEVGALETEPPAVPMKENHLLGRQMADYREIDISQGYAVLYGEGCYQSEVGGRVLSGDARLKIVATRPRLGAPEVSFTLTARGLQHMPDRQNGCTLSIDGEVVERVTYNTAHETSQVSLRDLPRDKTEWMLRIVSDHTYVPSETDPATTDDRLMSLWLAGLKVIASESPSETVLDRCNICGTVGGFDSQDIGGAGMVCSSCGSTDQDRARVEMLGEALGRTGPLATWTPDPSLRILEISGGSSYSRALAQRFDCVLANEVEAAEEPGDRACLNLADLPYDSRTFDAVLVSEVMEGVQNDTSAFGEIWRVLRTRGAFIMSPSRPKPGGSPEADGLPRNSYGPAAIARLEHTGFDVNFVSVCRLESGLSGAQVFLCWKPEVRGFPNLAETTEHVTAPVEGGRGLENGVSLLCATHLIGDGLWKFQRLHVETAFRFTKVPFEYILAVDVDRPADKQAMSESFRKWLEEFSEEHPNFSWYVDNHWYPPRLHRASREAKYDHTVVLDSDCYIIRDRWHDAIDNVDAFGFERPNIGPEWRFWHETRQPLDSAFFGFRSEFYPGYVSHAGGGFRPRDYSIEYKGGFFRKYTAARENIFLPMVEIARDRLKPEKDLALEMYHLPSSALARDGKRLQFLDPWVGLLLGNARIYGESRTYDEEAASEELGLLGWQWRPLASLEDPEERARRLEQAIVLHITYFSITSTLWQTMHRKPPKATEKMEKIYEFVKRVADHKYRA